VTIVRLWPTKRGWKRLAITFGLVVVLLVIADLIAAWLVEHKLQSKIAEIRAAGDPASIADLAPKPIPANQNAAAWMEQIAAELEAFSKDNTAFYTSSTGEDYSERKDRGQPPSAGQIEAVRDVLNKYPTIDHALSQAAACEQYASLADFSLRDAEFDEEGLKRCSRMHSAGRYLALQMDLLVADGETNDAVKRGIQWLQLARLYDSEPAFMHFMMALAQRDFAAVQLYDALAASPVSAEVHAALEEELARHDNRERIVHALKAERAIDISSLKWLSQWRLPFMSQLGAWPVEQEQIGLLNLYDQLLTVADQPWHEISDQLGTSPWAGNGVLAQAFLPALLDQQQECNRVLVTLRALRIFNALRQYAEENGREAGGLADLSLPKEATIDPYSGKPLLVKHTDDGWVIYSVLENGVDDGGDFKDMKDWGLAPPGHRGD
jgi:hypothetical protein